MYKVSPPITALSYKNKKSQPENTIMFPSKHVSHIKKQVKVISKEHKDSRTTRRWRRHDSGDVICVCVCGFRVKVYLWLKFTRSSRLNIWTAMTELAQMVYMFSIFNFQSFSQISQTLKALQFFLWWVKTLQRRRGLRIRTTCCIKCIYRAPLQHPQREEQCNVATTPADSWREASISTFRVTLYVGRFRVRAERSAGEAAGPRLPADALPREPGTTRGVL